MEFCYNPVLQLLDPRIIYSIHAKLESCYVFQRNFVMIFHCYNDTLKTPVSERSLSGHYLSLKASLSLDHAPPLTDEC